MVVADKLYNILITIHDMWVIISMDMYSRNTTDLLYPCLFRKRILATAH